jgi:hypothetical protein
MADEMLFNGIGESMLLPRDEEAVMEPIVTSTISPDCTWMMPVASFLLRWISSTVMSEQSANDSRFTLVSFSYSVSIFTLTHEVDRPYLNSTPWSFKYVSIGRIIESC